MGSGFQGFQGFKVSGFQGFRFQVSGFHPNRDRGRDRDRDRLFNHEHTGWHCSGFFGTPGGIPDFHEVSCLSWFHPNRGRDRDRYRDRLFHHGTLSWVSGFHGFIQIGIGVGIAIGIDCLPQNTRDGTARVFIHRFTQITQIFWGIARVFGERQREFLIFMKFHVFQGFIQIGVGIGIAIGKGFMVSGFKVSGFRGFHLSRPTGVSCPVSRRLVI